MPSSLKLFRAANTADAPLELARAQLAEDKRRTRAMSQLLTRKVVRMRASSVGFLRGAAPLFFRLCAEDIRDGLPGEGWIAGDLHLENFGVYRTAPVDLLQGGRAANVIFDLNDFDEAVVGPWRLDVLRLLTSLILGARGLGMSGARTVTLTRAMLDAYVGGAFGPPSAVDPVPGPVAKLLARTRGRTRRALLDARTIKTARGRRFVRDGARYVELAPSIDAAARRAFAEYARGVRQVHGLSPAHFEVVDTAFRIAGTGSLGTLRIAVLARGKSTNKGDDGNWIFDMKAQGEPSAVVFGDLEPPKRVRKLAPAERVLTAMQRCLEQPPHMVGTVSLGDASMLVRRLAPQEDKLNLAQVPEADLEPLARYLGTLTGKAHRRGAVRTARAWTDAGCEKLLHRAFGLAGAHEAVYLAYVRLTESM